MNRPSTMHLSELQVPSDVEEAFPSPCSVIFFCEW